MNKITGKIDTLMNKILDDALGTPGISPHVSATISDLMTLVHVKESLLSIGVISTYIGPDGKEYEIGEF